MFCGVSLEETLIELCVDIRRAAAHPRAKAPAGAETTSSKKRARGGVVGSDRGSERMNAYSRRSIAAQQRKRSLAKALTTVIAADGDANEGAAVAGTEIAEVNSTYCIPRGIVDNHKPKFSGHKYIGRIVVDIAPHLLAAHRGCRTTVFGRLWVVFEKKEKIEV